MLRLGSCPPCRAGLALPLPDGPATDIPRHMICTHRKERSLRCKCEGCSARELFLGSSEMPSAGGTGLRDL